MGGAQVLGGLLLVIGIALLVVSTMIVGIISGAVDTALLDQKTNQYLCEEDSKSDKETDNFLNWRGDNYFASDGVPAYYDMYLFSIHNPVEYVKNGAKAQVVETGPFVFQMFNKRNNIAFDGEYVSYSIQSTYVMLDEDHEIKGKHGGEVKTRLFEKRMNEDLTLNTQINNFNLGYVGVLNLVTNEDVMFMTVGGCSSASIMMNGQITDSMAVETCTPTKTSNCACCALPDTLRALNAGGFLGASTQICRNIDLGIKASGTLGIKAQIVGLGVPEVNFDGVVASAVAADTTTLSATYNDVDRLYEAHLYAAFYFTVASNPAFGGNAAAISAYVAANVDAGKATVASGVNNSAAASGIVRCTASGEGDPRFVRKCLTGGALYGHSLAGKFCDPNNGWLDASLALKVNARVAAGKGDLTTAEYAAEIAAISGTNLKPCTDFYKPTAAGVGLISLLASYDGGTPVLVSGQPNGYGGTFTASSLGQFAITTPIVTSHSANDNFFGYPVALLGAIMPMLALEKLWGTLNYMKNYAGDWGPAKTTLFTDLGIETDKLEFNRQVLNGKFSPGTELNAMGFAYPVADQAEYTARVGEVCADNCAVSTAIVTASGGIVSPYAFQCAGTAPDRYDDFYIGKEGLLEFASNECRPYSFTYSTKYFCGAIEVGIAQAGTIGMRTLFVNGAVAGGATDGQAAAAWTASLGAAKTALDTTSDYDAAVWIIADSAVTSGKWSLPASTTPYARDHANYAATLAGVTASIKSNVLATAATAGTVPCMCADATIDARASDFGGCCLAGGTAQGTPLTGFGCLTQGSGYVDVQFEDADLHASMQRKEEMYAAKDAANLNKQRTCPAEGDKVNEWAEFEGKSEYGIYKNSEGNVFVAPVEGGDGGKFPPMGLTIAQGEEGISKKDAHPVESTQLYVSQALRSLKLNWVKNIDVSGVNLAQYSPGPNLLNALDAAEESGGPGDEDAADKGQGTVANGLADISFFAPGNLALYLSQPNFMSGDTDALISEHDVYNCWEYNTYSEAESAFTEGVLDLTKCTKMDAEWVADNKGFLNVALDVEPGVGLTIGGHSRLQANTRTLHECDPTAVGNTACALGFNSAMGECHKTMAAGTFSSMPTSAKQLITAWHVSINGNSDWSSADSPGFPCSQASILTPKLMGGKVMPLYWADIWAAATDDILDKFITIGKANAMGKGLQTPLMLGGIALAVIGLIMIALCKGKASVQP